MVAGRNRIPATIKEMPRPITEVFCPTILFSSIGRNTGNFEKRKGIMLAYTATITSKQTYHSAGYFAVLTLFLKRYAPRDIPPK
jgi:hypothetical protein